MTDILYYSNYCENCKILLNSLARSNMKDTLHYMCIDNRKKEGNDIYIVFPNNFKILMPSNIRSVPSLLLLTKGGLVLEGGDIYNYLKKKESELESGGVDGGGSGGDFIEKEPAPFGINEFGSFHNDTFSFYDENPESMKAEGDGGLRQLHNYVKYGDEININTLPETYVPDKIKNVSLDKLRQEREKDTPQPIRRV